MEENRTRSRRIWFRVTEEEYEQLQKNMAGAGVRNREAYCRKMALAGYVIKRDDTAMRELIFELNKIGININQIVRNANTYGNVYQEDIESIKNKVGEIWQLLGTKL